MAFEEAPVLGVKTNFGGPVAAYGPPDPTPPGALPYADILNPQSLNKYQYSYNNPLRYIDPTGHQPGVGTFNWSWYEKFKEQAGSGKVTSPATMWLDSAERVAQSLVLQRLCGTWLL